MHFIKPVYVIEPFEISSAIILLVLVTAAIGLVVGAVGASAFGASISIACTKPGHVIHRNRGRR
jgi:hypothetical protein